MNIASGLVNGTIGILVGTAVASRISDCEVFGQAYGIYTDGNVNAAQYDVSCSTSIGIRMSPGDFAERNTESLADGPLTDMTTFYGAQVGSLETQEISPAADTILACVIF
jgi:hypothetical protein